MANKHEEMMFCLMRHQRKAIRVAWRVQPQLLLGCQPVSMEISTTVLQTLIICSIQPSCITLSIDLKDSKATYHGDTGPSTITAALCTTAMLGKQLRCQSTEGLMIKDAVLIQSRTISVVKKEWSYIIA